MAEADLGKVKLTDAELSEKIIEVNGGVRLGKDADGNPGYVVTDVETGADTVIPFSSGGGNAGGLPINGTICFAGTNMHSSNGSSSIYMGELFDEPIKISDVNEIKTITNINSWIRNSSGYTNNLLRRMYVYLILENDSGVFSTYIYIGELIINNTTATGITVNNKEVIVPKNLISDYENIKGIGCEFLQNGGGSGINYWFTSTIGNYVDPSTGKMEYVIS